jgi:hypothetical protein
VESNLNEEYDKNNDESMSYEEVEANTDESHDSQVPISETINEASTTLRNVNVIREELCKLSLNPCEREYYNNCILPLLTILSGITTSSLNLASSANYLSNSNIIFRKKSDIKDTLHLAYDINKKSEDVYKTLVVRIDKLLDCIK